MLDYYKYRRPVVVMHKQLHEQLKREETNPGLALHLQKSRNKPEIKRQKLKHK